VRQRSLWCVQPRVAVPRGLAPQGGRREQDVPRRRDHLGRHVPGSTDHLHHPARLVTADASFLVSSNARLRTSILQRDLGPFLDLCVRDRALSEAERAELAALAEAQDPDRPVRVREAGEPVRGGAATQVRAREPTPPRDSSRKESKVQCTLW
jgi:hypothetical protein